MEVEVNEMKRQIEAKNTKLTEFQEQSENYRDKI